MLIRTLRKVGVSSDMAFLAAGGSILTSIIAWRVRSRRNIEHAERLGIFIGLWAPTLTVVGAALKLEEDLHGTKADPRAAWSDLRGKVAKGAKGSAQESGPQLKEAATGNPQDATSKVKSAIQ